MSKREEIIKKMKDVRDKLNREIKKIPREKWEKPLGPDKWNLKSFIIHITHWNRWGFNKIRGYLEGEERCFQAEGPEKIDSLNNKIAEAWSFHPDIDIEMDFQLQFKDMLSYLESLPEQVFMREIEYGKKKFTIDQWFDFFCEHEKEHLKQLEELNHG